MALGPELWEDAAATLVGQAAYSSSSDTYSLIRNGLGSSTVYGPELTIGNVYRVAFTFSDPGTEDYDAIDVRGPFDYQLIEPGGMVVSQDLTATSTAQISLNMPDVDFCGAYTGMSVKQVIDASALLQILAAHGAHL
jgi:hypothetical protein